MDSLEPGIFRNFQRKVQQKPTIMMAESRKRQRPSDEDDDNASVELDVVHMQRMLRELWTSSMGSPFKAAK